MLKPDTFALTALLAVLTAIGPLTVDLYLPSLPEISRVLDASTAQTQLTISSYLAAYAICPIVYGPVSDRYGRKPVLLAALTIFCAATFVCAFAPSIQALIAARAFQAVGSSGTVVLARAVVRDLYSGVRAGRELSVMGVIMGVAPVVAPSIGSVLQTAFGWRACFLFVFAAGLGAFWVVWRLMPETRPRTQRHPFEWTALVRHYGVVVCNRCFLAHTVIVSASFAGLFAFISGSPFVLQDFVGLSPIGFGIAFAVASTGHIVGTSVAAHLVTRVGIDRTIGAGALALCAGGLTVVATTTFIPGSVAGFVLPIMLYMVGLGLAMPQALAGALQPFPGRAATASALVGFAQQTSAALAGAVVGHLLATTAWPLVLVVALCGVVTLIAWGGTRGARGVCIDEPS